MELPDQAARALAQLRADGRALRFTVDEVCHSGRHRLSVRYPGTDGREVRLGLLYDLDRAALEQLAARLVGEVGPSA